MLKEIRESHGMSQQDLADKSGIHKRMIQAYEQGYRDINGAKLSKLVTFCSVLECHLSEIVDDAQLVKDLKAYEATPSQTPGALFEYLIKTYTNEGETVLDNCAGSFTTAVACDNTNRNWICMEKEEKYCNIGLTRINDNRERLSLPLLNSIN